MTSIEGETTGLDKVVVAKKSTAEQRTHMPVTIDAAVRELSDRKKPVVVLIDEVQNLRLIDKASATDAGSFLRDVHEGVRGLPIMLVLAGLSNSPNVLDDCGLSRLDSRSRMALGPLSAHDLREAAEKFFDYFHVRGDERKRAEWAELISDGTGGWPHHLFDSLRSAAQAIADGGGKLDRALPEQACADALQKRLDYYADRTEPFAGMPELLPAVFEAMPEGTGGSQSKIQDAIWQARESHPALLEKATALKDDGKKVEEREFLSLAFDKLLRKGLIHRFGHNRYDCPIPSLRAYVEEFCAGSGYAIRPAAAPPDRELSGGMEG